MLPFSTRDVPHARESVPPAPWRRIDLGKACALIFVPALLLLTFYFPLRSPAPSRDQLRDALHELDNLAYAQSGCSDVAAALARCQKSAGACNGVYTQELRNLSRNCRSISTNELEGCLLDTPGGKCVFERQASDCAEGIREILACHRTAMTVIVGRVLKPLADGEGGGGQEQQEGQQQEERAPPDWEGAATAAASYSAAAEERAAEGRLSVLDWALPHAREAGRGGDGTAASATIALLWPDHDTIASNSNERAVGTLHLQGDSVSEAAGSDPSPA